METDLRYYLLPIIKLITFIFFLLICLIPFALVFQLGLIDVENLNIIGQELLSQAVIILTVLGALLMIFQLFKTYDFQHLFIVKRHLLSGFTKDSLIGAGLILSCSAFAMLSGSVTFALGKITVIELLGYILLYVMVAIFEEFLFRSFPLVVLSERYPKLVAVLVTSVLFGMAHLANPGFTWLAMINITLAGCLLASIILVKRNIYWAVGIHFGWNFTQGTILGYRVSGSNSPGVLVAKTTGSPYLSGGSFGIESSIYCTLLLLIFIVILLVYYSIEPVYEYEIAAEEI